MQSRQRGFVSWIVLVVVGVAIVLGGLFVFRNTQTNQEDLTPETPLPGNVEQKSSNTMEVSQTETSTQNVGIPTQQKSTPNVASHPTMTADRTNVTSGDIVTFTLNKYPTDAARWEFYFNCSKAPKDESMSGCNSNQSTTLSPGGPVTVTRQERIYNVYRDQTETVVFEAYDSSNRSLGRSTLSLFIRPDKSFLDTNITVSLHGLRVSAELYYDDNKKSYAGFCRSTNPYYAYSTIAVENIPEKVSNSVVCKDSSTAWAMSARMNVNPSQYMCADSTGETTRNSPITATNCKTP